MVFNISSWKHISGGKMRPVCQPTDTILEADKADECIGVFFKSEVDLHLYWSYFVSNYECMSWCPNHQGKD